MQARTGLLSAAERSEMYVWAELVIGTQYLGADASFQLNSFACTRRATTEPRGRTSGRTDLDGGFGGSFPSCAVATEKRYFSIIPLRYMPTSSAFESGLSSLGWPRVLSARRCCRGRVQGKSFV